MCGITGVLRIDGAAIDRAGSQSMTDPIACVIDQRDCGLAQWFDLDAVRTAAAEHSEKRYRSGMMWLLLVLGLWRQQNREVAFS